MEAKTGILSLDGGDYTLLNLKLAKSTSAWILYYQSSFTIELEAWRTIKLIGEGDSWLEDGLIILPVDEVKETIEF